MAGLEKKGLLKKMVGKMVDIGKTYKPMKLDDMPKNETKSYPSFLVDGEQAPFLKEYEVGHDCFLVVKARLVGHELIKRPGHTRDEYRLEIRKIGKQESYDY